VLPYQPTAPAAASTCASTTTSLFHSEDEPQLKTLRTRRTILIVDDNDIVRKMLKHALIDAGYHTFEAKNGMEAVEFMRRDSVHLITMDISVCLYCVFSFFICLFLDAENGWLHESHADTQRRIEGSYSGNNGS
jgi:PleD family two-component response regulator